MINNSADENKKEWVRKSPIKNFFIGAFCSAIIMEFFYDYVAEYVIGDLTTAYLIYCILLIIPGLICSIYAVRYNKLLAEEESLYQYANQRKLFCQNRIDLQKRLIQESDQRKVALLANLQLAQSNYRSATCVGAFFSSFDSNVGSLYDRCILPQVRKPINDLYGKIEHESKCQAEYEAEIVSCTKEIAIQDDTIKS